MNVQVERRAEIAFRSLGVIDQARVSRALAQLTETTRADLKVHSNLQKFAVGESAKNLFVYRAGLDLRLVVSLEDELCTVEDIVHRERLKKFQVKGAAK